MKLDRLVLVNWGQIRPGEYEMGDMTLLTGQTGSGKSTLLDALQTVMTAAYPGIYNYNPGQDEVTQGQRRGKTKRTLESYVVGAEYSRFSRPDGAHGYMAAVFRPSEGEDDAKPFTALVAASARVDGAGERREAKLERIEFVIVDEVLLTLGDFVKDAGANEWVAVEDIVKRLKAAHLRVTAYDGHKKEYLCALYGRFRGRPSVHWDEAQNAARAWCQSIAYKPIGSVHELVREEILEFDGKQLQESIGRISDLMRQVTNLKHEGQRLESTVARLKSLRKVIRETASAFEEQVHYDYLLARLQVLADEGRVAEKQQAIAVDRALVKKLEAKVRSDGQLRVGVDHQRVDVAARLSGIAAHNEQQRLEDKLARATTQARETLEGLSRALHFAAQLDNAARHLITMELPEPLPKLKAAVAGVSKALATTALDRLASLKDTLDAAARDDELDIAKLARVLAMFDGANTGIDMVHGALVGAHDSVSMAIAAEESTLQERLKGARTAVTELAAKTARIAAGGGNYPRETSLALDRLRERMPQANVQVLCDLLEPASEAWQAAIEGYIDQARFNLIVQPEWEARAIDFLQSFNSRAKIIQGKRCLERADSARVPQDSIIHELHTDNPIAEAYLIEQYGPVVKVQTTEQLRMTPRGLMKDGKGSGSRTLFICDQKELVLGRKARERAQAEIHVRLAQAEQEVHRLEGLQSTLMDVRRVLISLREPVFVAQPLETCVGEIESARQALARLDLAEAQALQERLLALEEDILRHDTAIQDSRAAAARAEQRIADAEKVIEDIHTRQAERHSECEAQIQRLKRLCEDNAEKNFIVLFQKAETLLETGAVDLTAAQLALNRLRAEPERLLGDVRESLAEYNAEARNEERFQTALPHFPNATAFDPYYGPLVLLGRNVMQLLADLESVGLYSNRSEIEKAERSFHDVFTKQFCVEIKAKVEEGMRALKQLNGELQHLRFGADRFIIDWSKWEPEFEDYFGFFKAVAELADSPEMPDLFGASHLSAKHVEVRDRLVRLLLDADEERAGRELLRIADYRNYRRYEIWNESESGGRIALSTWGTGSGGQLETPAYIVRAAVVTNRLKFFEKGPSLKLLVNDESFSKMDEQRARAVLRFLRDHLQLQLISAMPTKAAGGLRDEFNREYSFTRAAVAANGELDFVSDCDERVLKTDKIRVLWEQQRVMARAQAELQFEAVEGRGAQ